MKLIETGLLDSLVVKAGESARHRAHFNLHPDLNDPVQRLCIAMEPETYVRPHRHADPETWELLLILRGSLALTLFDNDGSVTGRIVLNEAGPVRAVEFPRNTWHAPVALEAGTVVFEVKQGPYKAIEETNLASWAPRESDPASAGFLEWNRHARVGDRAPALGFSP
jgi:cupin fold WbuC family metalloprotein